MFNNHDIYKFNLIYLFKSNLIPNNQNPLNFKKSLNFINYHKFINLLNLPTNDQ